ISNLIFHYNELIDNGDLKGAPNLFKNARLKFPGSAGLIHYKEALDLFEKIIIIYPDGTPKTRHMVTNLVIEISKDNQHADARSMYTVPGRGRPALAGDRNRALYRPVPYDRRKVAIH